MGIVGKKGERVGDSWEERGESGDSDKLILQMRTLYSDHMTYLFGKGDED